MPHGKPAGVRCIALSPQNRCLLFDSPLRPGVCSGLQPGIDMCGDSAQQAMIWLTALERATKPVVNHR
jgi:uncharacterized protein